MSWFTSLFRSHRRTHQSSSCTSSSGSQQMSMMTSTRRRRQHHHPGVVPSSDLWDLVMDMDWERVIDHVQHHSADAAFTDGHYHESVLYLACQHNPPASAIRAILEACPEAALITSRAHRDLPLHIACKYQLRAEILQALVNDFCSTAVSQTRFGTTPLMALWDSRTRRQRQRRQEDEQDEDIRIDEEERFWNNVMILLTAVARFRDEEYYNATTSSRSENTSTETNNNTRIISRTVNNSQYHSTNNNELILHAAAYLGGLGCPVEVFHHVLERYPEQARCKDVWGLLPLHIAVGPRSWNVRRKYRPRERGFIFALLKVYPDAAKRRLDDNNNNIDNENSNSNIDDADKNQSPTHRTGSNSRYPLMIALTNRLFWNSGVEDIFRAAPEVVLMQDPVTSLYPFQLAAIPMSDAIVDLDTIYNLLRACPEVLTYCPMKQQQQQQQQNKKHDLHHPKNDAAYSNYYCYPSDGQFCPPFLQQTLMGTLTAVLIGGIVGTLFGDV